MDRDWYMPAPRRTFWQALGDHVLVLVALAALVIGALWILGLYTVVEWCVR